MGYLGNTSGVNFLDVFTKDVFNGTGSQTAFTLSRDPGDEKAIEVFVNNVRQEPGSGKAYTVSGTTLTFSAAPSSATGNIYVIHVGRPMGTVDISNTAISNKTTITSLADTDKFLVHDATDDLLKSVAKSNMPGGGLTVGDQWSLTTAFTGSATPIASNWEQSDEASFDPLGSSMTESSGIFTFPSTGFFLVMFGIATESNVLAADHFEILIQTTINNSSYDNGSVGKSHIGATGSEHANTTSVSQIVDVTDTANVKVRFSIEGASSNVYVNGDTAERWTYATFLRLGDT